ncbi:MAG: hypothetical protein WA151_21580, partial [Desulfatirhabdiaceae bacterium]
CQYAGRPDRVHCRAVYLECEDSDIIFLKYYSYKNACQKRRVEQLLVLTTPATPLLGTRNPAGFFMPENTNCFLKPPLTLDDQVELLEHRGLIIENSHRLKQYLRFIGYYRLSLPPEQS